MKSGEKFQFGDFQIDPLSRTLKRREEVVDLNRRAFEVLVYLVQNPGRVLTRDDLVKNVWQDTLVDEKSLAHSISSLRRALDEKPGDNSFIVTFPGRGYQFVCPVKVVAPENHAVRPEMAPVRADRGVDGNLQPRPKPTAKPAHRRQLEFPTSSCERDLLSKLVSVDAMPGGNPVASAQHS